MKGKTCEYNSINISTTTEVLVTTKEVLVTTLKVNQNATSTPNKSSETISQVNIVKILFFYFIFYQFW
jgi:hypothetical protein